MDTRLHCPKPTHRGRPRRLREGPAPAAGARDARWRRERREGRQALLGAVLFALACLAVAILMPALTQARGDALRSMSEAVTFEAQDIGAEQMGYRSGSHDVAFCLDGSMRGPEGTTYQLTDERDPVAGYIVYHGFPNTTTICGQPLTETEAEVVTQLALWMHGGFLSREGVICETNEAEGYAGDRSRHRRPRRSARAWPCSTRHRPLPTAGHGVPSRRGLRSSRRRTASRDSGCCWRAGRARPRSRSARPGRPRATATRRTTLRARPTRST